jgi:hypothetical protein
MKSPLTSPMSAASETEEESRDGKHAFSFVSFCSSVEKTGCVFLLIVWLC